MRSRPSRDQSQAPPLGFKVSAGRSSVANTTRSLCSSFDSIVTCVGSTRTSSPAAVIISNKRAIAIEQRKPLEIMTWSPGLCRYRRGTEYRERESRNLEEFRYESLQTWALGGSDCTSSTSGISFGPSEGDKGRHRR